MKLDEDTKNHEKLIDLYRIVRLGIMPGVVVIAAILMIFSTVVAEIVGYTLIAIWVVCRLVLRIKIAIWRCPNCKNRFYSNWAFVPLFPFLKKCNNCGWSYEKNS
jgi:hypothetical protein